MGVRAWLAVLCGAALWMVGCTHLPPQASPEQPAGTTTFSELKLGCVLSMSGRTPTNGESTMNGIRLAIDEINAQGGVAGRKLTYVLEDNQGLPDKADVAARKLVEQNGVDVLVGDVTAATSMAVAQVAQARQIPMVCPSATHPGVTAVGNFVFRAGFDDALQGAALARFAVDHLKARTAAVLTDRHSDDATALSRAFREAFEKAGGKVVGEEFYEASDTAFQAPLGRLKPLGAAVLLVPGSYRDAVPILQQARQLGYAGPVLGGHAWDSPRLSEAGTALDETYYSVHVDLASSGKRVRDFVQAYTSKFQSNPDTLSAEGYDTVYWIADAVRRAGAVERAKVREALATTHGCDGVTGTIVVTTRRDPAMSVVILGVKNGHATCVSTIAPPVAVASPEAPHPAPSPSASAPPSPSPSASASPPPGASASPSPGGPASPPPSPPPSGSPSPLPEASPSESPPAAPSESPTSSL